MTTPPAVILPLSDDEIADLRTSVDSGKKRRVVLLVDSAGLPAGKAGEVTRVGRPEVDGSDFIGVRISGDDLFFSPAEIALPSVRRASTDRAKADRAKAAPPKEAQADVTAAKSKATPAPAKQAAPAKSTQPADAPAPAAARPAAKAPAVKAPAAKAPAAKAPATALAAKPVRQATARPAGRLGRKPPRLPAVAITVRSTDGGWTVEAHRGGKVTLKATPVRAGTVQEIADALDEDAVTAVVREVLDSRRAVAEAEAEELREALARAEAVLAEYEAGH